MCELFHEKDDCLDIVIMPSDPPIVNNKETTEKDSLDEYKQGLLAKLSCICVTTLGPKKT